MLKKQINKTESFINSISQSKNTYNKKIIVDWTNLFKLLKGISSKQYFIDTNDNTVKQKALLAYKQALSEKKHKFILLLTIHKFISRKHINQYIKKYSKAKDFEIIYCLLGAKKSKREIQFTLKNNSTNIDINSFFGTKKSLMLRRNSIKYNISLQEIKKLESAKETFENKMRLIKKLSISSIMNKKLKENVKKPVQNCWYGVYKFDSSSILKFKNLQEKKMFYMAFDKNLTLSNLIEIKRLFNNWFNLNYKFIDNNNKVTKFPKILKKIIAFLCLYLEPSDNKQTHLLKKLQQANEIKAKVSFTKQELQKAINHALLIAFQIMIENNLNFTLKKHQTTKTIKRPSYINNWSKKYTTNHISFEKNTNLSIEVLLKNANSFITQHFRASLKNTSKTDVFNLKKRKSRKTKLNIKQNKFIQKILQKQNIFNRLLLSSIRKYIFDYMMMCKNHPMYFVSLDSKIAIVDYIVKSELRAHICYYLSKPNTSTYMLYQLGERSDKTENTLSNSLEEENTHSAAKCLNKNYLSK